MDEDVLSITVEPSDAKERQAQGQQQEQEGQQAQQAQQMQDEQKQGGEKEGKQDDLVVHRCA